MNDDIQRGIQIQREADQVVIDLQHLLDPDYSIICPPWPLSEGSWMITIYGQRRGIEQHRIYNMLTQVGAVGKSYLSSTGYVAVKFELATVKPVGPTVTILVSDEVNHGD